LATVHFLLVYDLSEERLVSQAEYYDVDVALSAYAEMESLHANDDDKEIVLIGADSIETVMRTHGQYFPDLVRRRYLVTTG
jgi:hypothetical protein